MRQKINNHLKTIGVVTVLLCSVLRSENDPFHDPNATSSPRPVPSTGTGLPLDSCYVGRPPFPTTPPGEKDKVFVPPQKFDVEKCKKKIVLKKTEEHCLTALGYCRIRTVNGGQNTLREPIDVEFSCINHIDPNVARQKACESFISSEQVHDSDVRCGGNLADL